MRTTETYRVRPAGRHILTIGRELIQDPYAAVVELVKNAYDADSPDVEITFRALSARTRYTITILDRGHGMSRDTVINKWLVPSTGDKLTRKISPGGRTMQGRKGIGRFATAILGEDLRLETTTPEGQTTVVCVTWKDFESAEYLDQVEILVEDRKDPGPRGTCLTITGNASMLSEWDQHQIDKLRFELKKLISPVKLPSRAQSQTPNDSFVISLSVEGFLEGQHESTYEIIEPYPIFDLYDYRIAGKIDGNGAGTLIYSQQKTRNTASEEIPFAHNSGSGCGELIIDIRAYDREREAVESLIGRGLKDEAGNYVSKLQARQLLDQYNGIGVYRNGFRIRPLGDPDFDWLRLNEQRVQNPSLRVGGNQVIGYVQIQSEEQSGLSEKSARDGLRENAAFTSLKQITKAVIAKLEERRFAYRKKAGLSRPALKLERELEKLFSYDDLRKGIREKILKHGGTLETADELLRIITKDEIQRNHIASDIRQTVAIYQGQATLGKIINVILHEGRRPLNYFKNEIPNLTFWLSAYLETGDPEKLTKFLPSAKGVGLNADVFVKLFSRLDPLAAKERSDKRPILLKPTIQSALAVFTEDLKAHSIVPKVVGPDHFRYTCWEQDIYAIFTNLVDNSIYWIKEKKCPQREIHIVISAKSADLEYIDYRDTGPGIEPELIRTEVIFEPEFSTKPEGGTGLGLAIAGEAAARNGLELKAFESQSGAYFRLQSIIEESK